MSQNWLGHRALRWVAVVAVGAIVAGFGVVFGLPLLAQGFVWGLRAALDGVLWLAVAITTGTDVWTIAGTAGRALVSSLVTPQAIGGTGGLAGAGGAGGRGVETLVRDRRQGEGVDQMTGKPHLLVRLLIIVLGAIAFHVGPGEADAAAQTPTDVSDLRAQLERRFDVLPLQDGVMLRPRSPRRRRAVHRSPRRLDCAWTARR